MNLRSTIQFNLWRPISWLALILLLVSSAAQAQTTQFTYQGRLTDSSLPANGSYDFQFKLFDALAAGAQVGGTLSPTNVNVSNGVFTVTLDFGAPVFPGANRWLDISVRLAGGGAFTQLTPRQPITSTPYAIKALSAEGLAATCVGCITGAQIGSLPANSGNYIQNSAALQASSNFNISGNGFIGGQAGIGTTTLFDKHHVSGGGVIRSRVNSDTNAGFRLALNESPKWSLATITGNDFLIFNETSAQEALRIDSGSNSVGIGTTAPLGKLEVASSGGAEHYIFNTNYSNSGGSNFVGRRARGTIGTPSAVQNGDNLVFFGGRGYGTTGFSISSRANLTIEASQNWTDAAQGTRIHFSTTLNGSTTLSERMRIENDGKVGIATTAPGAMLDVVGGAFSTGIRITSSSVNGAGVTIKNTDTNGVEWNLLSTGSSNVGGVGNFGLYNNTDNAYRLFITGAGNMGVGTITPARRLHVIDAGSNSGNIQVGGTDLWSAGETRRVVFGDGTNAYVGEEDADDRLVLRGRLGVRFKANAGSLVAPDVDNVLSLGGASNRWTTVWAVDGTINTSDARMKKGITNLNYGLSQIMQLRPVSFQWKDRKDGQLNLGLIAQEVEQVIPEAVVKAKDETTTMGLNYSSIVPVLIKAVQEQQTTLERKDAEIKAVRAENDALNQRLAAIEQLLQQQLKEQADKQPKQQ